MYCSRPRLPGLRRQARLSVLVVSILVVTSVAAACGGGGDGGTGQLIAAGDVERRPPDAEAARAGGAAITALGTDLFGILRRTDGNLTVSPYSLAVALAMARAGAAGVTAEQMDAVLHASRTDDLHAAFGSLDASLARRPGEFPVSDPDDDPLTLELSFANSVWPQAGFPFVDAYLETLAAHYGAGVRVVDYVDDTEGARQAINRWVGDQTRGRIPELVPSGALSALTRLVLTNALYLKAPWRHRFEEGATVEAPFHRLDGTTVQVPLMHVTAALAHGAGDGWQAVEVPYVGGDLAMVVLVPDDGRFAAVEEQLDADLVGQVEAALSPAQVQLALPRWEFRTRLSLTEPLQELGMPAAFSDDADFSGMSPEDLAITDVLQEVFVSVDEEGTEAAAATAVVVGATAAPPEPVLLTVDRPYLFWIVDRPTGALLFLGRVLDTAA